jgi:hypothetical protein
MREEALRRVALILAAIHSVRPYHSKSATHVYLFRGPGKKGYVLRRLGSSEKWTGWKRNEKGDWVGRAHLPQTLVLPLLAQALLFAEDHDSKHYPRS